MTDEIPDVGMAVTIQRSAWANTGARAQKQWCRDIPGRVVRVVLRKSDMRPIVWVEDARTQRRSKWMQAGAQPDYESPSYRGRRLVFGEAKLSMRHFYNARMPQGALFLDGTKGMLSLRDFADGEYVAARPWNGTLRAVIHRFYGQPGNGAGGHLHVVLDDGNVRDSDIHFCIREAEKAGDWLAVSVARVLLASSMRQRLTCGRRVLTSHRERMNRRAQQRRETTRLGTLGRADTNEGLSGALIRVEGVQAVTVRTTAIARIQISVFVLEGHSVDQVIQRVRVEAEELRPMGLLFDVVDGVHNGCQEGPDGRCVHCGEPIE